MSYQVKINDPSRKFVPSRVNHNKIVELINQGPYLSGERTRDFEDTFARYLGMNFVIGVSSGTEALRLAISALDLKSEQKIAITPNAGGYAQIAAKLVGTDIEYFDIDNNGLIDIGKFIENYNPNIKAIVVTHLFGQIQDLSQLIQFSKEQNIDVIEDCAQATGSQINNKMAGSFGDLACFSFYPTKNLSTIGDAGAVATNNQKLNAKILQLKQYGWSEKYNVDVPFGNNSRMDEFHAEILLQQLQFIDSDNDKRRKIWHHYLDSLGDKGEILIGKDDKSFSCHLTVCKTKNRNSLVNLLHKSNIDFGFHYPYLDYQQKAFKVRSHQMPTAEMWVQQILTIPNFTGITDDEVNKVSDVLKKYRDLND